MRIYIILLLQLIVSGVQAENDSIKWLTIEEADSLSRKEPKPLLIDVYTDWCGWCKHLDKTTYADPAVISFINRDFYPVKLNAETSDTVSFQNKIYPPIKNRDRYVSSLAAELLQGKMSYPTTIFRYDKERINMVVPGYLDVLKMQSFLVYFTENAYRSSGVNEFVADFEKVFKAADKDTAKNQGMEWIPFSELDNKRKKENKKVLLYLRASWNNSAKMMEKTVLADSAFKALATKYFYCLQLDAQSQDTITFMTHQFVNGGKDHNNLHQLAIALSDRILRVPAIYIFDENGKLMEPLYYYLDKKRGRDILDFIGSDTYKNMSWNDYLKVKTAEDL